MAVTGLLTKTCQLEYHVPTGSEDLYGHPITDVVTASSVCHYWRRTTSEVTVGGEQIREGLHLMLPSTTDPSNLVAVTIDGSKYEIDGRPMMVWNPRVSRDEYLAIYLRRGDT